MISDRDSAQTGPCFRSVASPAKRHGTYYRWTCFIAGKRTTKTISKQPAEECERRIKNSRALQHKLDQIAEDALVNAPWNQSP